MASPILEIVRICRVRTYSDRVEYLNWMQCWAAGLVDFGGGAW